MVLGEEEIIPAFNYGNQGNSAGPGIGIFKNASEVIPTADSNLIPRHV